MSLIHWLEDVGNPLGKPAQKKEVPSKAILWSHPVTGTQYYLDVFQAGEITRQGLALAMALLKKNGPEYAAEKLSDFFALRDIFVRKKWLEDNGFQTENGEVDKSHVPLAALWPELPFPGQIFTRTARKSTPLGWLRGEGKPCIRLADFLLLRTGLFHALASDRISGEEWCTLRLTSLLEGSDVFAPEKELTNLRPVPDTLRSIYETASWLAGYSDEFEIGQEMGQLKADVIEGGAFKIKEYYLETNRISEIRGASVLLDGINRRRYIQMFRELPGLTTESIVYAGGGHLMAVVPAGKGEKVAEEIERVHREVCLTARAVGVSQTVTVSELGNKLDELRECLAEKMADRRSVLVPAWEKAEGVIDLYEKEFHLSVEPNLLPAKTKDICDSCGIRPAYRQWQYEDESRDLCASCLRKHIVGQDAKKSIFLEEYRQFWQARGTKVYLKVAGEIDEIADSNNEIAVIYADGNNFGPLFGRCKSLPELRLLSQFSENAAYTAVFTALKEKHVLLEGRAVEIIALGGDDIFLLVPARAALPLAVTIGEYFDRLFENLSTGKAGPTLSLGVVIAGAKTPVRYIFEMAQGLLKEAKKRIYKAGGKAREGTLDVAVLASYATYQDHIVYYRQSTLVKEEGIYFEPGNRKQDPGAGAVKTLLTLRPYTFTEARRFLEAVNLLQTTPSTRAPGRSWFYGLRVAAEKYGRQVAELFFRYQYARLSEEQRETLKKSWEIITGANCEPGMFFSSEERGKDRYYCPWLDVVELWNYVGAEGDVR
ncbi:hypothetical protein SAMN02745218_02165 [Desulfofundulus australicus DSM 11792]|uniref:GGDEF domain-containing protein n=1 Tax=Desulfofundulus australicus DSM 11792 TaxID=1121425 RepID=A0A1M5BCM2_9FIRM|nr:hypothetical protein [Desulfofundulus australicus]SHF40168.1 hypothetical protein SAMN02745218_02165 [Desulfofundulus australicus DSM 11792]